jgi:hypothetical protein
MERFNALGRGAQIMLVSGVLLFISLFLPWQDFDVGGVAEEFGVDATFSGWRGIGVVLGILSIAVVAWIVLRLAAVDLNLPVSWGFVAAALGALVVVFGVIKWLTIIDDEATLWAWIGLILSLATGVGAWLVMQSAGGFDAMRSEMPGGAGAGSTATTEAAPPPPPPPPAAPPEPQTPAEAASMEPAASEPAEQSDRET